MITTRNWSKPLGLKKRWISFPVISRPLNFNLIPRIKLIADKVVERGTFKVIRFKNKPALVKYADRICEAYNKTFVNNWEYYPLTKNEVKFAVDQVISFANPKLIKIIEHQGEVVGFPICLSGCFQSPSKSKWKINFILHHRHSS